MKCVVNSGCIGCGYCASVCPEVFFLNSDGVSVAITGDVPIDYEPSARDAVANCPVNVIEIV